MCKEVIAETFPELIKIINPPKQVSQSILKKLNIKKLIIQNIVQLRNNFKKGVGGENLHPKRKPKSVTKKQLDRQQTS